MGLQGVEIVALGYNTPIENIHTREPEHLPNAQFQHLEKRYFDVGNEGFKVWRAMDAVVGMCICNDRR